MNDLIYVELTPGQRARLLMMLNGKMNNMIQNNPVAWAMPEYQEAAGIVEALMNNCID